MSRINFTKLKNHVAAKWVNPCPMCGAREWSINNRAQVYAPINNETNTIEYNATEVFPVALVTCAKCKLVLQVSPVLAGAFEE